MSAILNGRKKIIAAKLDMLGECARQYAHGAASLEDLGETARDYVRVLESPMAKTGPKPKERETGT